MFAKAALPLYEHIRDGGYDTVICVHLFPALMVTKILELYDPTLCTAFVATDYTCSPSVGDSRLGCCFIPAPSLAGGVCHRRDKCRAYSAVRNTDTPGIYTRAPKAEAKRSFGIEPSHQHLVAMTGSIGCGPLKELTETLAETMTDEQELTVVCGANEKLHRHLASRYAGQANIHILGFEKNVSLLLDSADLYLTKPGGISVTEAAAKALPMVLIDAIAAVEEYNLDFLRAGAAVTAATPEELAACRSSCWHSPSGVLRCPPPLRRLAERSGDDIRDHVRATQDEHQVVDIKKMTVPNGAVIFSYLFLRVRWRCSEYMRLSAILLSDSCMNFLSLSSKSMFPLVDAAGGTGVRAGFFALRLRFSAARGASCFGGSSARFMERLIRPLVAYPDDLDLHGLATLRYSFTSLT